MDQNKRDKLRGHVVGRDWRLLRDDEVVTAGDETGCVSCLLSLNYPRDWSPVVASDVGRTVAQLLVEDMDREERVFRRPAIVAVEVDEATKQSVLEHGWNHG